MHFKNLALGLVAVAALFVGGAHGVAAGAGPPQPGGPGATISFTSCVPDGYSGPAPMDPPVTGCSGPLGPTFGLTPDANGLYWFWLSGCDSNLTCDTIFRSVHFTGCRQPVASDYYDDAATIAACQAATTQTPSGSPPGFPSGTEVYVVFASCDPLPNATPAGLAAYCSGPLTDPYWLRPDSGGTFAVGRASCSAADGLDADAVWVCGVISPP